ncbi:MAG: hypothetical protein LBP53_07620 [Candidatus Peribacteria bacterium]|nr:hypothetical protein [Candidatus Peribacteria bacterium]
MEPKNFEKIVYFEDPYSDYTTIFPTRFIDGAMIYGSEYLYKELYDNFEKDIQEMPQNSFKPFKSRITYAADINNV